MPSARRLSQTVGLLGSNCGPAGTSPASLTCTAAIFCNRDALDMLMENELAFAVRDKFPVRPLHTLILPKLHVAGTFELTPSSVSS